MNKNEKMFVKSIDNFKNWRYNKGEHFFQYNNHNKEKRLIIGKRKHNRKYK